MGYSGRGPRDHQPPVLWVCRQRVHQKPCQIDNGFRKSSALQKRLESIRKARKKGVHLS